MPAMSLPSYFLCFLTLSSACYIQNCPRGGKRSYPEGAIRQCMSCGSENQGNCFGPKICCGKEMGCYMGTPETERCIEENDNPIPCESGGKRCIADGKCAAPNICCNEESCTVDATCIDKNSNRSWKSAEKDLTSLDSSEGDLLLKLMHMANANQHQQDKHQVYRG